MDSLIKKSLIAANIALAFGVASAQAGLVTDLFGPNNFFTDSANFTMLSPIGGMVGGTNDVVMTWDGNAYNASSDYTGPGSAANITAASTTQFFGRNWAAHDIQVFTPGSYSFDVTLGGGAAEVGSLDVTVGAGQIGMHMLFDWGGGDKNIDMFVVANQNSVFGSGIGRSTQGTTGGGNNCDSAAATNCLYDGPGFGSAGKPAGNKVWMLSSTDGNGDGIMGIPMAAGGPFAGFNANFNATLTATPDVVTPAPVPVPAAVWLLGSGLLGLVGVARRRKISE